MEKNERLRFNIDNVELIDEDHESSFALLSLDFFSDGDNLHDLYVSTETLMRNADTIKGCPVLWAYDEYRDDIGTHDNTTICGFIPESSQVTSKIVDDGRTMLTVVARVWKIYSGQLLDFFKRDGDKPVSVEMSVFDIEERDSDIDELLDYKFEAVAILGSRVTPAIINSRAEVVRFEKEYRFAYYREFAKYDGLDFSIPWDVRENASIGLKLKKEHGRGGNSLSSTIGRHLSNNDCTNPKKIRHINKIFSGKRFDNRNKDEISNSYINFMLYGGEECKIWANDICEQLEEIDNKKTSYFEQLAQEEENSMKNKINKEDEVELEQDLFEDTSPKEEEEVQIEEMAKEEKKEKEEKNPPEEEEEMAEEEGEEDDEEESEDEESEEEEMSISLSADMIEILLSIFNEEEENYSIIKDEFSKEEKDYPRVCELMYGKMIEMSDHIELQKSANEELSKFKKSVEQVEFANEVKIVLKQIEDLVDVPPEVLEEMREKSLEFDKTNIKEWEVACKARAFSFNKKDKKDEVNNYDISWLNDASSDNSEDIWHKWE